MLRKGFIAWEGVADEFLTEIMCTGASVSACCLNKYLEPQSRGRAEPEGSSSYFNRGVLFCVLFFLFCFFAMLEIMESCRSCWLDAPTFLDHILHQIVFSNVMFSNSLYSVVNSPEIWEVHRVLFLSPSALHPLWCHEGQIRDNIPQSAALLPSPPKCVEVFWGMLKTDGYICYFL